MPGVVAILEKLATGIAALMACGGRELSWAKVRHARGCSVRNAKAEARHCGGCQVLYSAVWRGCMRDATVTIFRLRVRFPP